MLRFLAGVLIGVALGAASTYVVLTRRPAPAAQPVAEAPPPPPPTGGKRRPHGGKAPPRAGAPDEPAPVLAPGDEKIVSEGDSLKVGPRSLDMAEGAAAPRDLEQSEIDAAVARRSGAIVKCITDARGEAALSGRVTVGFVVKADGGVSQTRVEAPAYLIHHGLAACVRPQLSALRLPAVGKDTVVTVPFDIE